MKALVLASLIALSMPASAGINLTRISVEIIDWSTSQVHHREDCTVDFLVSKNGVSGNLYSYVTCDSSEPPTAAPSYSEAGSSQVFHEVMTTTEGLIESWNQCVLIRDITDTHVSGSTFNHRTLTFECTGQNFLNRKR